MSLGTGKAAVHCDPVVSLEVPGSLLGERLDRAVALLTGLSRSESSQLVESGRVTIEGVAETKGSRRLREGEHLELLLARGLRPKHRLGASAGADSAEGTEPVPPGTPGTGLEGGGLEASSGRCAGDLADSPAGKRARTRPAQHVPSPEPAIVYSDRHLVVVDKPAGLVVHPGAGNTQGTLAQKLVGSFPDIAGAGPDSVRPGIVHRLDKGTSGLVVVARTPAAREALASQMAARTVLRKYLAVVHGEMEEDAGTIEAPLGRSVRNRRKMAVVSGGRPARTHYRVVARSDLCFATSLLVLRLETGRTHQVRAHLAAIGHCVVGDEPYSGQAELNAARSSLPFLARPWLHAAVLGFVHPVTGEEVRWVSEPPLELARALDVLGLATNDLAAWLAAAV